MFFSPLTFLFMIIFLFSLLFFFIIIQILEGFLITPKLVGNKIGLSSLTTMLALIIGGNLGGFLGMLCAIPAAGILKISDPYNGSEK